jgi:uncharacterized protein YbjT (DUF2867 family)
MKVTLFGATGKTGRELLDRALAQGHDVRAFARNPGALHAVANGTNRVPGHLDVQRGDMRDLAAVRAAVEGADAVLVALGPRGLGPDSICSDGTRVVIEAMQQTGVRRLVCVTSIGVGDSRQQMGRLVRWVVAGVLLRNAMADKEKQEALIRASGLDWVIVRPGSLHDGPATGRYRVGTGPAFRSAAVARADVAEFMLRELTDATYLRATPSVVGPA